MQCGDADTVAAILVEFREVDEVFAPDHVDELRDLLWIAVGQANAPVLRLLCDRAAASGSVQAASNALASTFHGSARAGMSGADALLLAAAVGAEDVVEVVQMQVAKKTSSDGATTAAVGGHIQAPDGLVVNAALLAIMCGNLSVGLALRDQRWQTQPSRPSTSAAASPSSSIGFVESVDTAYQQAFALGSIEDVRLIQQRASAFSLAALKAQLTPNEVQKRYHVAFGVHAAPPSTSPLATHQVAVTPQRLLNFLYEEFARSGGGLDEATLGGAVHYVVFTVQKQLLELQLGPHRRPPTFAAFESWSVSPRVRGSVCVCVCVCKSVAGWFGSHRRSRRNARYSFVAWCRWVRK